MTTTVNDAQIHVEVLHTYVHHSVCFVFDTDHLATLYRQCLKIGLNNGPRLQKTFTAPKQHQSDLKMMKSYRPGPPPMQEKFFMKVSLDNN